VYVYFSYAGVHGTERKSTFIYQLEKQTSSGRPTDHVYLILIRYSRDARHSRTRSVHSWVRLWTTSTGLQPVPFRRGSTTRLSAALVPPPATGSCGLFTLSSSVDVSYVQTVYRKAGFTRREARCARLDISPDS